MKYIETGPPMISGFYVCFVRPVNDEAWESAFPISRCKIVYYTLQEEKWACGDVVLGWIGPLPAISLDELDDHVPCEAGLILYFIGPKDKAKELVFDQGPFYQMISASLTSANDGDYLWQLHSRKTKANKVAKWNEDDGKWEWLKTFPSYYDKYKRKDNEPWEYVVSTKKGIVTKEYHKPCNNIQAAMGSYQGMGKGHFIWEYFKGKYEPRYRWKDGWSPVNAMERNKVLKMVKIIEKKTTNLTE